MKYSLEGTENKVETIFFRKPRKKKKKKSQKGEGKKRKSRRKTDIKMRQVKRFSIKIPGKTDILFPSKHRGEKAFQYPKTIHQN